MTLTPNLRTLIRHLVLYPAQIDEDDEKDLVDVDLRLGMPLAQYVEENIVDPLTDGHHGILRETVKRLLNMQGTGKYDAAIDAQLPTSLDTSASNLLYSALPWPGFMCWTVSSMQPTRRFSRQHGFWFSHSMMLALQIRKALVSRPWIRPVASQIHS